MKNSKILFFTDIHGSLYAMKRICSVIEEEQPDKVVFLGDHLYHGPRNPLPREYNPLGIVELINSINVPTILIKGNCDAEIDEMVLGRHLFSRYTLNIDGKQIICTHGHKLDKLDINGVFAVLYGHYHVNRISDKDRVHFINVSSASLPKDGCPESYGMYNDGKIVIKDLFRGNILMGTD